MTLLEICNDGVKEAIRIGADEAELYAVASIQVEVSIEKNDIQLARSQVEKGVGIRVFKNKGLGFASVSEIENIKEGCKRAVELANASPQDEYNRLPTPIELKEVPELYDPAAENFTVSQALEYALTMLEVARSYDQRITVEGGIFSSRVVERAIANSNGVQAEERTSNFVYYIMGMAIDGDKVSSFQYEFDGVRFVSQIDTQKCAKIFAKKVIDSLGATKGESFKGKVILSPEAVEDLIVDPILHSVNANSVQKGMSRWKDKIGVVVGSTYLTVEDNGLLPGGLGSSMFDREGMPHSPLTIIEEGRLLSYMYNTYTAMKENRQTTGHASGGASSVPRIGPTNFTIKEGNISYEELIKGVNRGVLVTRFSGFPNPISGEFSGVVKGGWLIKNGQLATPLCETLIQGNIYDLLHKIFAISKERKKVMDYLLPWIGIEDVSITAG